MANRNAGANAQKSRAEHELRGTFRKDRHAALANPEPTSGPLEEQPGLDEVGLAEWERMQWRLGDMKCQFKVDQAAVYQYCQLFAQMEHLNGLQGEARESLKALEANIGEKMEPKDRIALFGEIVELHRVISKYTSQLISGRSAIRQYLVEFGLTPASRGRVKLPPKQEQAVDPFAAMQQARIARVK